MLNRNRRYRRTSCSLHHSLCHSGSINLHNFFPLFSFPCCLLLHGCSGQGCRLALSKGRRETDPLFSAALLSSRTSIARGNKLQGRHAESHCPATQQALKRARPLGLSKIHCSQVHWWLDSPTQQLATNVSQKSKPITTVLRVYCHCPHPSGHLTLSCSCRASCPASKINTWLLAELHFQSLAVAACQQTCLVLLLGHTNP